MKHVTGEVVQVARFLWRKGIEPEIGADMLVFRAHLGGKVRQCRIDISSDGLPEFYVVFGELKEDYDLMLADMHYTPDLGVGAFKKIGGMFVWSCLLDADPDDDFDINVAIERMMSLANTELYAAYPLIELMLGGISEALLHEQLGFLTRLPEGGMH